ncbi:calcium-binding protein [Pseudorhodobacter sp.]|uniref:EF-hand domain-containing protein n=1 Tax=Pseudorhodobacter sp. TaxID=1934400 RepID=UPI002B0036DB|nr:calcium-binding protein [Pseudorhodobacter sp.]
MKTKTLFSAVTLAAMVAASFSTIAYAEVGQRGGDRMGQMFVFEDMDADSDGKVTQAEIAAFNAAKIAAMDTDKDGNLSEAELIAGQEQRRAERKAKMAKRMIEMRDANKDGVLSLDEMAPPADRGIEMFKRADADGDGAISKAEADAMKDKMDRRSGGRDGDQRGKGKGKGKNGGHKHGGQKSGWGDRG